MERGREPNSSVFGSVSREKEGVSGGEKEAEREIEIRKKSEERWETFLFIF